MSAVLNRQELRARIDLLEALDSVIAAIDDIGSAELAANELVDVTLSERGMEKRPIAFAHGMPPQVLLVGLRAMQEELQRLTQGVTS